MAQRTMPQNEATKKQRSTHNGFPMSYAVATTQRYGDIDPFFYIHTVGGDKIPLQSSHELRSHTLASPLLSGLQMHKEYYEIPMRAILPNTWEYIFANPTQGDDVPYGVNNPYCSIPNGIFNDLINRLLYRVFNEQYTSDYVLGQSSDAFTRTNWFKDIFLLNKLFSNGELLAKFGYRLSPNIFFYYNSDGIYLNWDKFFDKFLENFYNLPAIKLTYITNERVYIATQLDYNHFPAVAGVTYVSYRRLFEILADDPSYISIEASDPDGDDVNLFDWHPIVSNLISPILSADGYTPFYTSVQKPFDFSLLAAYQLTCAHFYTNDHIDFVYSANLYRNLLKTYILNVLRDNGRNFSDLGFSYNGQYIEYDAFSGYFFVNMFQVYYEESFYQSSWSVVNGFYGYMYGLFGIRNSLKFGDYFTGARPYPLAVGDVNLEVNNSEVSAIDITRNIQLQRFLNNVNRAGRKFSNYLRTITDGKALPMPTDPKWLASQHYNIGGNEIENTSGSGVNSPQGNIVLNLRSQQSKFSLEYRDSEPSIVIGLCWFDAMRLYSKSNDRHFFREDRFDFFNKDMQYIGDQEIYGAELTNMPYSDEFAYTLRNMEDKQRVSIATCGFVEALPSWAFVCDNEASHNNTPAIISPEFIRSTNAEFDRFYKSLSRYDSAGYFHFIIYHYNQCEPVRPMAFAPSIL